MYEIYHYEQEKLVVKEKIQKNCWIKVISPNSEEVEYLSRKTNIPIEFLEDSLDLEESARIEYDKETESTLIINDFPIFSGKKGDINTYVTIPIGTIITKEAIITVCTEDTIIFADIIKKQLNPMYKTRFALETLLSISKLYLSNLKKVNKDRIKIESDLRKNVTKMQLYDLMEIQKSLVYFLTSTAANGDVLDKMLLNKNVKMYEEDRDLLDEVIIENTQAIKTTELYSRILDEVTDSYSSLISSEMNSIMKTLTLVTVFLTIPTLIFSFFGMNVDLPIKEDSPVSWMITLAVALVVIVLVGFGLWRKKIF